MSPENELEALLQSVPDAQREALICAWHRTAQGDPESAPVQFALAQLATIYAMRELMAQLAGITKAIASTGQSVSSDWKNQSMATVAAVEAAGRGIKTVADNNQKLVVALELGTRATLQNIEEQERFAKRIEYALHRAGNINLFSLVTCILAALIVGFLLGKL